MSDNFLDIHGIHFVEFSSSDPISLHKLFIEFGFSRIMRNEFRKVDYYRQNDIHFFLNYDPVSYGGEFRKLHGPSICSMGWRVKDANLAFKGALDRGAVRAEGDYSGLPAIYGIGESLIYFVQDYLDENHFEKLGFKYLEKPDMAKRKGLILIDHLTNNVEKGTMEKWSHFYQDVFGFSKIKYFDIRGQRTGLTSFALKSPCGTFCIPINEGTEDKSQVNEFLKAYKGPGIQHVAFLSHDIIKSIEGLKGTPIETLRVNEDYYRDVFKRVPNVTEEKEDLKRLQILVDGDQRGYLLQIFTKSLVGPIFIEIIQRKNYFSFGEGNFHALFRSLERDQEKRGYFC